MKKPLKDTKGFKIVKTILGGLLSSVIGVPVFKGTGRTIVRAATKGAKDAVVGGIEDSLDNLYLESASNVVGGEGNYTIGSLLVILLPRLIGLAVFATLLWLLVTGKIDWDMLEQLWELYNEQVG